MAWLLSFAFFVVVVGVASVGIIDIDTGVTSGVVGRRLVVCGMVVATADVDCVVAITAVGTRVWYCRCCRVGCVVVVRR